MVAARAENSTYRPEIQGVRTIGALLVACFHIWGGRVSGGVDVFFVISGFLITGSLYREDLKTGGIRLIVFWGRIARRVAPVAYFVLALTTIAAFVLLPGAEVSRFLSETIASVFHVENINLMMKSVDYLERDAALSPVQQFWALSIQIQFYAVWPFMILATGWLSRLFSRPVAIPIIVLTAVFVTSLAYSITETAADPAPTYFNPLARVWEFSLGGLAAILLPHVALPHLMRILVGWAGLALIVSCGFIIPASIKFPGYVALWPTLGAVLVLASTHTQSRYGVDRILASKPLVLLGDVSFSFYLWHWPILIFYTVVQNSSKVGLGSGLLILLVSLVGAYVTTRFLEQPLQRSPIGKQKPWQIHALSTGCAAPVIAAVLVWIISLHVAESRREEAMTLMKAQYQGGAFPLTREAVVKPGIPIYPPEEMLEPLKQQYCQQSIAKSEVITCERGVSREEALRTVVVVGGSHSEHWLPAIGQIAQEQKWRLIAITKGACPFMFLPDMASPCAIWNESVYKLLVELQPDMVFTTSTRRRITRQEGESIQYVPESYLTQWERLAEKNIQIVAIRDNPKMQLNLLRCVAANPRDVLPCSRPRHAVIDPVSPVELLNPQPKNVAFIDLTDRFCDQEYCYPVGGNVLIYRDTQHITREYARTLAAPLSQEIKRVRPDLFSPVDPKSTDKHQIVEADG
ncbi:acyltransferase family protein [Microvirga guangxiensis]|uniref:Peptidoglycan/LPS O-acetylase OafA/YrhL, contains acyltransferase and SGNH-hydrolase domains n=1 Tax=Microvirga guangxiensis TaxID=549386 RepID=A0A1G5JLP2_9HYPH|nr:acyltransferase family protein [Microvirga guangxiensis]SCY89283.1 Peptidoglycan/LPS O-acetylase OafA/YrhL, contains acyltransferase and SGNH-hydrolase domains [Microvirga guangxiensis]